MQRVVLVDVAKDVGMGRHLLVKFILIHLLWMYGLRILCGAYASCIYQSLLMSDCTLLDGSWHHGYTFEFSNASIVPLWRAALSLCLKVTCP